jgi:protein-disulfide isomerase
MNIDRRKVILGALAVAGMGSFAPAALAAVDIAKLHAPSPIGEMAMGPETAKVTIVEYASSSCPHCANFYKTTFKDLRKDYIDTGKVRFLFREFPHNDAGLAGFMLARCVPKEKYFPVVDMLFEQQEMWLQAPLDGLFKIAQLAGLTRAQFDACLKNEEVAKGIIGVREMASNEFGVKSIPTFFVNGEMLKGESTIEEFKALIDPQL